MHFAGGLLTRADCVHFAAGLLTRADCAFRWLLTLEKPSKPDFGEDQPAIIE
jgi:hypothetical protein